MMARIAELHILTEAQVAALGRDPPGVQSEDDLWACVTGPAPAIDSLPALAGAAQVLRQRLDNLAAAMEIPAAELVRVLSARSEAITGGKAGSWPQRHWLTLAAGLIGGILLVLAVRGLGWLQAVPEPLGLAARVQVASHDLRAGDVLGGRDVQTALLPASEDYFTATNNLDGMTLAQAVGSQKPLRRSAVLRPQVVAVKDLPAGSLVARDAVSLTWSAFQAGATTRVADVVGHRVRTPTRAGQVVGVTGVETTPTWIAAVTLKAPVASSAYEVLSAADLEVKQSTAPPADPQRVITPDDVAGRAVLALRPSGGVPPLTGQLPARVGLVLVPKSTSGAAQEKPAAPLILADVILLARQAPASGPTVAVLAVTVEDLGRILPVVGMSDATLFEVLPK